MKIFIANWKMNFTTQQALAFCQENIEALKKLEHKLIVCPSFPALTVVSQIVKDTDVAVCGQSCSSHASGPFTGQVSAKSLAESGCSYVLVGHSEERAEFCLSNKTVAEKTLRVFEAGMIPIVCIGEPTEVHDAGKTQTFLEEQLTPIKEVLKGAPAYIAYEPIWAIGTGKTPTPAELKTIFDKLKSFMGGCAFFYGGSVTPETIKEINSIELICGYLVGGASLKFDELSAVIKSC